MAKPLLLLLLPLFPLAYPSFIITENKHQEQKHFHQSIRRAAIMVWGPRNSLEDVVDELIEEAVG